MTTTAGFLCSCCNAQHDGLPFSYGFPAPAYWNTELDNDPNSLLADEQCVIKGQHFFIRARIVLPVLDSDEDFEWGVWVSLSEINYASACGLWTDPRRINEPPYFGWLSTELACYEPTTLNLKSKAHTQPVGTRPVLELEPTDHPLAVEQRTGITRTRVQYFAERLIHPDSATR